VVASDGGFPLPVVDAFAHSMAYFKGELTKILDAQSGGKAQELSITWVITLPAIWSDSAKKIMVPEDVLSSLTMFDGRWRPRRRLA